MLRERVGKKQFKDNRRAQRMNGNNQSLWKAILKAIKFKF